MPFETVRELEQSDIGGIEDLSEREKRIFLEVFNSETYQGGSDEGEAIAKAFSAAKKGGGRQSTRTRPT